MRKRIFAAISAFMLCLTPLTASADGTISADSEAAEESNLSDYTTDYDALHEADGIMFSGNQVLITFDLMVQVEGCCIDPDQMEWEISGTADVTYTSDSFFKSLSYEENYANTYCLITAESAGTVCVKGTEIDPYTQTEIGTFYWNLNVGEDGNFDGTVDMDNPIEPIISGDSVYFPKPDTPCEFSLIVSSNLESSAVHDNDGCIMFTPKEDGWYVVSTRSYCEEIVECGTSDVSGHFHYFYPVLHNYAVIVKDGEIRVNHWGDKSWYSEEQISEEVTAMEEAVSSGDVQAIACYDVYAADPDDVMDGLYYSFVNGQLPAMQGNYDSYITNVYGEYGTDSYFCVNYSSADIQQDINGNEPQRVTAEEQDISSLLTHFWTSSTCDGDLTMPSPDVMEFTRIAAPEDGDLTIAVDNLDQVYYYLLTVEEGIFHHRKETSDLMGDCSGDGTFSVTDIIMLQKYLLGKGNLTCWQNADLYADNKIDAFDLCVMKRELLEQNTAQTIQLTADTASITTAESAPVITFRLDANNYSLPTPNDALPVAMLYRADTDEPIAVMTEEGSNLYAYTLEIDNSEMGMLNFYATVNGKDGCQGDTVKSDIVSVEIIHVYPVPQTES